MRLFWWKHNNFLAALGYIRTRINLKHICNVYLFVTIQNLGVTLPDPTKVFLSGEGRAWERGWTSFMFLLLPRKLFRDHVISLNWKEVYHMYQYHVNWVTFFYETSRIKRGVLSKLHYYVTLDALTLYDILRCCILSLSTVFCYWVVLTLLIYTKPLFIFQKHAIKLITSPIFDEHSSPLFKQIGKIKSFDIVTLHVSLVMLNPIQTNTAVKRLRMREFLTRWRNLLCFGNVTQFFNLTTRTAFNELKK